MSSPNSKRQGFLRLAYGTLASTLGVIVWGAYVRASGSGAGCGSHWPLCNGEIVPRAPSIETIIELSHRLTSGLALLLVVALAVQAFRVFPAGHLTRRFALWTVFFMLTEAAVGAGLVLFDLVADNESMARAMFMAAHLVNTFFLLASMTLVPVTAMRDRRPAWRGLRRGIGLWLVIALAGLLIVGASGAVAALGDTLYPSGSLEQALRDDLSASSHLLIRLRLVHPTLAVAVAVLILIVVATLRRGQVPRRPNRERVDRWARWLGRLVLAQIALGLINVFLLAPIHLQLLHLLLADFVWIGLVTLTALSLEPVEGPVSAREPALAASEPAAP